MITIPGSFPLMNVFKEFIIFASSWIGKKYLWEEFEKIACFAKEMQP